MDAHFADLVQGFSEFGDSIDLWAYEVDSTFPVPKNVRIRKVDLHYYFRPLRKIAFHTQIVRDLKISDYDSVIGTMRTSKQDINICGGTHLGFVRNVNHHFAHNDVIPAYFERRTVRSVEGVVAHSKMVAKELQKYYGVQPTKIFPFYPPVNETRFHQGLRQKRKELKAKYEVTDTKFVVFFPSTNHKIKGLTQLLEAFSLLPSDQFELLIAGASMDGATTPQNVRYLGYLSQVEEIYVSSDLTILPSHYDGFGLVMIESLACGTPVVVSTHAGASEIIDPLHGIILENEKPQTIADAIIRARETQFCIDDNFLANRQLMRMQYVSKVRELAQSIR